MVLFSQVDVIWVGFLKWVICCHIKKFRRVNESIHDSIEWLLCVCQYEENLNALNELAKQRPHAELTVGLFQVYLQPFYVLLVRQP